MPLQPVEPTTGDVEYVMGQTAAWIQNADTETGLLLTGLVILLGALSPHSHDLRTLWTGHDGRPVAVWILAVAIVLLAVAFGLLVLVLLPRTKTAAATRYAWPWLATASVEDLVRLGPDTVRREGWQQAKQLAEIATRKYRLFTAAVWVSALSVACYLVWSIARS